MLAAGWDLGSLLTQMKQKPPAMQQALDFHAEYKLFLISNWKPTKILLKHLSIHWIDGLQCPAMTLNNSNETETGGNASSPGFSCTLQIIFNKSYSQQSTPIIDLFKMFHSVPTWFLLDAGIPGVQSWVIPSSRVICSGDTAMSSNNSNETVTASSATGALFSCRIQIIPN